MSFVFTTIQSQENYFYDLLGEYLLPKKDTFLAHPVIMRLLFITPSEVY